MKKLLWLALCLGALAGRARAQAAPAADIVVVRVFEDGRTVRFVVDRGGDKVDLVESGSGPTTAGLKQAARSYYELLSRLGREGYVLQGTIAPSGVPFSDASAATGGFATLLFVKKP